MRGKRLWATIRLWLISDAGKRSAFLREKGVFFHFGEGSLFMDRIVPLYPELISIGSNVKIASNVHFVTHDITHIMLNKMPAKTGRGGNGFKEKIGCIEIGDNVFIGSGTRILYDVRIGANCIIGAGSLVSKDIPANSVAVGVPAHVIKTIDEYISKRVEEDDPQITESKEEISQELGEYLWGKFRMKHDSLNYTER